jgi:hypothetical protein
MHRHREPGRLNDPASEGVDVDIQFHSRAPKVLADSGGVYQGVCQGNWEPEVQPGVFSHHSYDAAVVTNFLGGNNAEKSVAIKPAERRNCRLAVNSAVMSAT